MAVLTFFSHSEERIRIILNLMGRQNSWIFFNLKEEFTKIQELLSSQVFLNYFRERYNTF